MKRMLSLCAAALCLTLALTPTALAADFERFDLRREAFDGSSERVALLRGAPCRRKEAGGDRQRKEESLHGS